MVRVHLPLKQGLRLGQEKGATRQSCARTSASSIKTRIKTPPKEVDLLIKVTEYECIFH